MDKLVFTALNTLSSQRFERQSITNELANLSTVGFKKSYELALETIKVSGGGFDSRFLTRVVEVDIINMKPGTPMATGRALDVMMNDATVLGVQAEDGSLAFTRRGDLRINDAGLVETGAGDLVLEAGGGPLSVPPGSMVSFGPDGAVYATDPLAPEAAPVTVGQLYLRDGSEARLVRRSDGLFTPFEEDSAGNGDIPIGDGMLSVTSGALEGSNASAMDAMVRMIDLSRSFETNVRIMRETRDLDQQGASMMRLA